MTPTSPDSEATPDPGAIDLHAVGSRNCDLSANITELRENVAVLIAAVETLRERNTTLLRKNGERARWASDANDRADAAEARGVELERERDLAVAHDRQDYPTASAYEVVCKARTKWQARAEAAEGRGAALAGALEKIGQSGPVDKDGNDDAYAGWEWCYDLANAVLAATPSEVSERAKAVKGCVTMLRSLVDLSRRENWPTNADFEPAEDALAKLDALGKEGG